MAASSIYTIQTNTNTIYNTNYGVDINVTSDLPSIFTLVSGTTLLANAIYRRLITPYGALGTIGGDPNYGIGVYSWLNSEVTQNNIFMWQSQAQQQILLDERISTCTCIINYDVFTSVMTMTINVFPFIGEQFTLILPIQTITAQQLLGAENG